MAATTPQHQTPQTQFPVAQTVLKRGFLGCDFGLFQGSRDEVAAWLRRGDPTAHLLNYPNVPGPVQVEPTARHGLQSQTQAEELRATGSESTAGKSKAQAARESVAQAA